MNIPNMIMLFSGSPRLGKVNVHIGASVSIPSEWKVNQPYGNLFVCITCILDTYILSISHFVESVKKASHVKVGYLNIQIT